MTGCCNFSVFSDTACFPILFVVDKEGRKQRLKWSCILHPHKPLDGTALWSRTFCVFPSFTNLYVFSCATCNSTAIQVTRANLLCNHSSKTIRIIKEWDIHVVVSCWQRTSRPQQPQKYIFPRQRWQVQKRTINSSPMLTERTMMLLDSVEQRLQKN